MVLEILEEDAIDLSFRGVLDKGLQSLGIKKKGVHAVEKNQKFISRREKIRFSRREPAREASIPP